MVGSKGCSADRTGQQGTGPGATCLPSDGDDTSSSETPRRGLIRGTSLRMLNLWSNLWHHRSFLARLERCIAPVSWTAQPTTLRHTGSPGAWQEGSQFPSPPLPPHPPLLDPHWQSAVYTAAHTIHKDLCLSCLGNSQTYSPRSPCSAAVGAAHIRIVPDLVGLVAGAAVALQNGVHVGGGVLEELAIGVEDDQRYVTVAQDAELHGLLHQAVLALGEGDLRARPTAREACRRHARPTL